MKSLADKNIFLTGGAGFIGSNFSEMLVTAGVNVTVYDNLSFGRYEFIEGLVKNKNFKFVKADVTDTKTLNEEIGKAKPDVMIHFAANPDIRKGIANNRLDLEQGTIATYNLLDASRNNDVKDILFSSSSAVYGDATIKPTPETYGPLKPTSLYAAAKLAAEGLITSFSNLYGFNYYIYRFANVVGKNIAHGVIFDLTTKLRKSMNELEVLGDGKQVKSYIDVVDCINGMTLAYTNSPGRDIYNISIDDQISVAQIAEIVASRVSPKAKIRYTGTKGGWPGDVTNTFTGNKKLVGLGFKPQYKTSREVVLHTMDVNNNYSGWKL